MWSPPRIIKKKKITINDNVSGYNKVVISKLCEMPNGLIENFYIDETKDSCQVFILTTDDQVVLVNQYRAGPEKYQLELPGGACEENESPIETARREVLEETGFSGHMHYLCSMPYSPYSTGKKHCCVAINCEPKQAQNLDVNEFLEVVVMPLKEFIEQNKLGKIRGTDTAYMALDFLGRL